MRKVVAILALLLTATWMLGQTVSMPGPFVPRAAGGPSAPTVVQAGACNGGGGSCTVTLTLTAGNHVFCGVSSGNDGATPTLGCADNKSDTYNSVNSLVSQSVTSSQTYIADNITGGSTIITCSTSNAARNQYCVVLEYHSSTTTADLDKVAGQGQTATATPSSGATAATTQANELVIGYYGDEFNPTGVVTAGSGYSIPSGGSTTNSTNFTGAIETKTVSATGAQTATFAASNSPNCTVQIATVK